MIEEREVDGEKVKFDTEMGGAVLENVDVKPEEARPVAPIEAAQGKVTDTPVNVSTAAVKSQ